MLIGVKFSRHHLISQSKWYSNTFKLRSPLWFGAPESGFSEGVHLTESPERQGKLASEFYTETRLSQIGEIVKYDVLTSRYKSQPLSYFMQFVALRCSTLLFWNMLFFQWEVLSSWWEPVISTVVVSSSIVDRWRWLRRKNRRVNSPHATLGIKTAQQIQSWKSIRIGILSTPGIVFCFLFQLVGWLFPPNHALMEVISSVFSCDFLNRPECCA